ncbi:MAG: phosphotransferase [Eubacteriales bacterium]|nr:phosphotransferase [Eubacteriales bacterium]MDD3880691.1 phosphotransferase [Eubacteriales bacterium]MDD4511675.1 phosphotransferase [Eubacteriales bacterium]
MKLDKVIAVRTNKTVYRDGDDAVKVFSTDYSKSDVLNEALNQARAEETELKVPELRSVTKVDGKWAIVSEFVAGKTLQRLMDEEPDKKDEYLEKFVDLQLLVHKQTSPLLPRLRDKMNRKISMSGLDATARYELHTRLEGMPKHQKLCHGDFNPKNIIVKDDGTYYILDWAHATQGNASADAARTYLLFWLDGDMNGAEKYLNLFCKKSDTARQYVEKWIPIVAASQLVKGKPQEKEFLMRWASVVDYE